MLNRNIGLGQMRQRRQHRRIIIERKCDLTSFRGCPGLFTGDVTLLCFDVIIHIFRYCGFVQTIIFNGEFETYAPIRLCINYYYVVPEALPKIMDYYVDRTNILDVIRISQLAADFRIGRNRIISTIDDRILYKNRCLRRSISRRRIAPTLLCEPKKIISRNEFSMFMRNDHYMAETKMPVRDLFGYLKSDPCRVIRPLVYNYDFRFAKDCIQPSGMSIRIWHHIPRSVASNIDTVMLCSENNGCTKNRDMRLFITSDVFHGINIRRLDVFSGGFDGFLLYMKPKCKIVRRHTYRCSKWNSRM